MKKAIILRVFLQAMEGMQMPLLTTDRSTEKEKESRSSNFANQLFEEIQVIFSICLKFCITF